MLCEKCKAEVVPITQRLPKMQCPVCSAERMWLDRGVGWRCGKCLAGPYLITCSGYEFIGDTAREST